MGANHLGTAYALSDQADRAEALLTGAAAKADRLGLQVARIWCMAQLAMAKNRAGVPEAGVAHAQEALDLARTHGCRWLQVEALRQLARGNALMGGVHTEPAEPIWLQAIELAEQLEARPALAHAERGLGELHASGGRVADAKKHLCSARDLYRSMGLTMWLKKTEALLDELA